MKEKYIRFSQRQLSMLLRLISIQADNHMDKKIDDIPVFDDLDDDNWDIGASKSFIIRTVTKVM